MRYLTEQEVIAINLLVIERYSPKEHKGVKLPDLLNSPSIDPNNPHLVKRLTRPSLEKQELYLSP
jgi:death-on-curing protein